VGTHLFIRLGSEKSLDSASCRRHKTRYPLPAIGDSSVRWRLWSCRFWVDDKDEMRIMRTAKARSRAWRWLYAAALIALMTAASAAAWLKPPPDLGTLVGERLEFRLKWQGIPAADATLEVEDGGEGRILFKATAKTVGLANFLYPVESRIVSTARLDGFRAERYVKDGHEGREPSEVEEIVFDLEQGTAVLSEDGVAREPVEVPFDVRDPFAAFYGFRVSDPDSEGVVEMTISDGKRTKSGKVRVVAKERVRTPAGIFDTIKIAPEIEGLGGVFKKSPGATLYIWLTDDEWRRPVMMRSKVSVGSFTARLTSMTHPAGEEPQPDNSK